MSTQQFSGNIGATVPSDHVERLRAIDTRKSVLVQAPAGSGKTTLLTQRFLSLLAKVDNPREIVAITFTTAAAAEMRHRILSALSKAAEGDSTADPIAVAAIQNVRGKGWDPLDQPALLRISTIDAFCRELALQQPLLSGLGGGLSIANIPGDLYREAARRTLKEIDNGPDQVTQAISDLLTWRDNSWHELEDQLVTMLGTRDRWMQGFVFDTSADEKALRVGLERPFARAIIEGLTNVSSLLSVSDWSEIRSLIQFACGNLAGARFVDLATHSSFPAGPFVADDEQSLLNTLAAYKDLADLVMTQEGKPRKSFTKNEGFPPEGKGEKKRVVELVAKLADDETFWTALTATKELPPLHFTDADWQIVRACFVLLSQAVGHLKSVFAEVGKVDFVEVAQIAMQALYADEGAAGEGAFALSSEIRHLLVDEFQDTSRRQHRLLAGLIAHWDDREGRTCFVVGDPLQSIYFFRDADAELFPRVGNFGLELPNGDTLPFEIAQLTANFRTEPVLVEELNRFFAGIFGTDDGSGIAHTPSVPARKPTFTAASGTCSKIHLNFVPVPAPFKARTAAYAAAAQRAKDAQTTEIVDLVRSCEAQIEESRGRNEKFRIAILGRAHKALIPIATALREAGIRFRALDLEPLGERPEVADVIGLARAILNKEDRVAWLGVLRAPWCGLSLEALHLLTSADDQEVVTCTVAQAATERLHLLDQDSQEAVRRVLDALDEAAYLRAADPTSSVGAWLESVWLRLGGAACVDAQARANVDLLWGVIDQLPNGEQDLLGPALQSALDKLTAQPDPLASSEYGVQLMTIHKSKGLEFEVVVVPDLQAASGGNRMQMLSWLERGISEPDECGDLTEFLVAPFQTKGAKGGATKKWVDGVYGDRERQESRRLLYVAATRARDELHLFALPEYRIDQDGTSALCNPTESLLATAWSAIEGEVREQFEAWRNEGKAILPMTPQGSSVVASTTMRRLPTGFSNPAGICAGISQSTMSVHGDGLYAREAGGVASRVFGLGVHTLLESIAMLRKSRTWDEVRQMLQEEKSPLLAKMRAGGLTPVEAKRLAEGAMDVAEHVTYDALGQWILDPHVEGDHEVRWVAVLGGAVRTVQTDRVFRASAKPLEEGDDTWWVVDYKTANLGDDPESALPALRTQFAPQLETYGRVLRKLHGSGTKIRAGIYYPRWQRFDHWELCEDTIVN